MNKAMNNGAAPAIVGVEKGPSSLVQVLLNGGADVNKAMNNGATLVPLATAASARCPGRILRDSGLRPLALRDS